MTTELKILNITDNLTFKIIFKKSGRLKHCFIHVLGNIQIFKSDKRLTL